MPNSTDIHFLIKSHFLMKSTDSLSNPPTIIFIRFTCSGCKERLNQTYQTTNIMNIQNIHFSHVITQMKTKTVVLPYVRFTKGNKNTIDSVPTSHSSTQRGKKERTFESFDLVPHLLFSLIEWKLTIDFYNCTPKLFSIRSSPTYFMFNFLPDLCTVPEKSYINTFTFNNIYFCI